MVLGHFWTFRATLTSETSPRPVLGFGLRSLGFGGVEDSIETLSTQSPKPKIPQALNQQFRVLWAKRVLLADLCRACISTCSGCGILSDSGS